MRKSPEEVVRELTGSPMPTTTEAQEAAQDAREQHTKVDPDYDWRISPGRFYAPGRTRSFRGTVDGRPVLVTIHDPEGYGEIAFNDAGRWGPPAELHEEA